MNFYFSLICWLILHFQSFNHSKSFIWHQCRWHRLEEFVSELSGKQLQFDILFNKVKTVLISDSQNEIVYINLVHCHQLHALYSRKHWYYRDTKTFLAVEKVQEVWRSFPNFYSGVSILSECPFSREAGQMECHVTRYFSRWGGFSSIFHISILC